MLTNYLDRLLLILGFPVVKDTPIGMFSYVLASIFVIAIILFALDILIRLINRNFSGSFWTWFLLIIILTSGAVYWASIKIPYSVQTLFPILKPHL